MTDGSNATHDPQTAEILRLRRQVEELTADYEALNREAAARDRAGLEASPTAIIRGMPGMVATLMPDGSVETVSHEIIDYFGQPLEELRHWGTNGTVHAEDLPMVADIFGKSIANGAAYDIEHRMRIHNGAYRWFGNRGIPFRNSAGEIIRWCVLLTDIHEQKAAAERLRLSEYNARLVLDSIPALVSTFSATGELEQVNPQVLAYFGKTLEEMKNWAGNALTHPDDLQRTIEAFSAAIASGEPFKLETRVRRADGVFRWHESRGLPLRDSSGAIIRWYNLLVDIDERKRAEEALRENEVDLRKIIDAFPTTAWSTRPDGYCDFLNQGWLDYAGYTAEEAVGWAWSRVIHPDDAPGLVSYWQGCLASGKPVDTEARMRRHDGEYRWFLFRANPLLDEHGNVVKWYGTNIDIEDRKRAEQNLVTSERRLQLVIDSTPAQIWTTGPDGRTESVNQHFLEYIGCPLEELQRTTWGNIVHPDDHPSIRALWQSLQAAGISGEGEARIRRHDGEYRWFLLRAQPVRNEDGEIVQWYGVNTDIEDRKRAEERLLIREHELKLLINTIPALVWSARVDGSAEFVNQHYLDYVGLSSEQMQEWGWAASVHPDDRDRMVSTWSGILASGEAAEIEARLRRFDGVYRSFLFRMNPLRDDRGSIIKWYGVNTDIDDRKRAEADLIQASGHLNEAQRLSRTGSFTSDLVRDEHTWSKEFYRICDFDPGSKVTIQRLQDIVHPEDVPLFRAAIESAMAGADPDFEFRIVTARGELKHLRGIAHRFEEITDRPVFLGAIHDVTERKRAEDGQNKARSELAHVTRVSALNALTASIAHEINQPLAGIITNANTCLRLLDMDPPNLDAARTTAQRTIRDGNRATEIVGRLRALFSKRTGKSQEIDLNEAANEVIALISGDLRRNRVILRTDLARDLPRLTVDKVQVQQVILNLLMNASDAMSGVDDRQRLAVLKTARDGDTVRLSVRDLGIGVAPEEVDKLFQAFFTTKTGGMGIGLSVSRSIVEAHNGRIWVEANDGPGATFSLSIPIALKEGQTIKRESADD